MTKAVKTVVGEAAGISAEIPHYQLVAHSEWRKRINEWKNALDDLERIKVLQDIVYECVLAGADKRDIKEFFNFSENAAFERELGECIKIATAERRMIIKRDALMLALTSRQPIPKIFVGKALGGMVDTPDVSSDSDDGNINLQISVVRREDSV